MTKILELHDLAISEAERAEAEALQQAARDDPQVLAQAEAIYERYRGDTANQVAQTKGITKADALARIPRYSATEIEKSTVYLDSNHPVWIKGQWITVEELVARGGEFDGCSMADPHEGPRYGRTTAKFYFNNGNPVIHSLAHGESITYLIGEFKMVEQTNKNTLVSSNHPPARVPRPRDPVHLSEPLKVDGFPHVQGTADNLRPKATVENYRHFLNSYGITVRYNVIAKEVEINIPGMQGSPDNRLNSALTRIESLAFLNGLNPKPSQKYIAMIADEQQFNPIEKWIHSRPWDGRDRLPDLYRTLVACEDFPENLKQTLLYRWLLSAVAAVLMPSGFHSRGVLTLQGPQGLGKTSWIRSLVTDPALQEAYVLEGHHLDPANKDTVLIAVKHWLVELGELDSSFKKDIARIKGFITNKADKVRKPYAAAPSDFQRRTVLAASVNEVNFLVDPTGNSRWWVIPLVSIDYQHGIDMQQVFAQLGRDFAAGERWWLTRDEEELLESNNRWHEAVNVIEETLLQAIEPELPEEDWTRLTASEVLHHLGYSRPTNPQARDCGTVLRKHFGDPKKINGIYKWRVPFRPDQFTRINRT